MTPEEIQDLDDWARLSPEERAKHAVELARASGCHLPAGEISQRILMDKIAEALREAEQSAFERAAKWHDEKAAKFRKLADSDRECGAFHCSVSSDIEADFHELCAQSIRDLGKQKA